MNNKSGSNKYMRAGALALVLLGLIFSGASTYADSESTSVTVTVVQFACSDGTDNDFDGLTDYPSDPGCSSPSDDNETDTDCADGIDNDGDGLIDYPSDPGCQSADDDSESAGGGFQEPIFKIPGVPEPPVTPPELIVTFFGLSQPGGLVTLLIDGTLASTTVADENGKFFISMRDLTVGTYLFSMYSTDKEHTRSGILSFSLPIVESALTEISNIFIPPTSTLRSGDPATETTLILGGNTVPDSDVSVVVLSDGREWIFPTRSDRSGGYTYILSASVFPAGKYIAKTTADAEGQRSPFGKALALFVEGGKIKALPAEGVDVDLNKDGKVDIVDFSILAYWYQRKAPPVRFDFNKDKAVNLVDFSIMMFYWTG